MMKPIHSVFAALSVLLITSNAWSNNVHLAADQNADGKALYFKHCANCHEGDTKGQAPSRNVLLIGSARSIYNALDSGRMASFGAALSEQEKVQVAEFVAAKPLVNEHYPEAAFCDSKVSAKQSPLWWNGWGGNSSGDGFKNAELAKLSKTAVANLELAWAFALPGVTQMRTVPAIFGDSLIYAGQSSQVLSLNKNTGCIQWLVETEFPIRGGVIVSEASEQPRIAFTGDGRSNVYAINTRSGKLLWQTNVAQHQESSITAAPAIYQNTLFIALSSGEAIASADPNYPCCTSSGELVALDTTSGKIKWRYKTIKQQPKAVGKNRVGTSIYAPSGAPVWATPTVDAARETVYIGVGQNYTRPSTDTSDAIIAIDINTGQEKWRFQATKYDAWNIDCYNQNPANCPTPTGPDFDFGMAPIIHKTQSHDWLLAGQKSGTVWVLNPENGSVVWHRQIAKGTARGGIHWGMSADANTLYAPVGDHGPIMFDQFPKLDRAPGLYALDIETGNLRWQQPFPNDSCTNKTGCVAANSGATTSIEGVVFATGLDGFIRAYATQNGQLLWQFDSHKPFDTINGIEGAGGAIDSVRPIVADGMLYLNSGYGFAGQMPGNVLLAFKPKTRAASHTQ